MVFLLYTTLLMLLTMFKRQRRWVHKKFQLLRTYLMRITVLGRAIFEDYDFPKKKEETLKFEL